MFVIFTNFDDFTHVVDTAMSALGFASFFFKSYKFYNQFNNI